jgi:hypothetical protein
MFGKWFITKLACMRNNLYPVFLLLVLCTAQLNAQQADTTIVQTFSWEAQNNPATPYDSPGRRWFAFPSSNNGTTYQKILMYYNLKCFEDGTAGGLGYPCGEWDYLTYTYLYDHTGVIDSTLAEHPRYFVNNANFDSVALTSQPIALQRSFNQGITVVDEIIAGSEFVLGDESTSQTGVWFSGMTNQSVFLYRPSELLAAGLTSGESVGSLAFWFDNPNGTMEFLRVEYALVSDSVVSGMYDNASFNLLYDAHASVDVSGWNDLVSNAPLMWDGTSSLIIRVSFTQSESTSSQLARAETTSYPSSCSRVGDDRYLRMDWQDEVRVPAEVFSAVSDEITIMFWQNGDPAIQPQNGTIFEGVNALNQRVLNVHLPWSNGNVYWDAGFDGGYDRINKLATESDYEGRWNHWAFTKNSSTGSMKIYLNGVLWHSGVNLDNMMLDIQRFSIGGATGWSNFYNGSVDEFAVFSSELDGTAIAQWMLRDLNPDHPNWSDLQVYYPFNELDGNQVMDASGHNHHAWLHGNAARVLYRGDELHRNAIVASERPILRLTAGEFVTHQEVQTVTVNEAIPPVSIVTYEANNYYPVATQVSYGWVADETFVIGADGDTLNVIPVEAEYTLNNDVFQYWQAPFEVVNRYELNRFITPYGIQLDLGPDGWTWVVDVTDWAPLLRDSVELEAGNWQELLDMKFVFIEGTPARDVLRLERVWDTNQGLNNFDNVVQTKTIAKNPGEVMWKLRSTTTGHQFDNPPNCAEFCNNMQKVEVNNQSVAQWEIMQECADNPLYPQGGTWIFDRAGWCPGMNSTTKEIELTPFVGAADTFTVDYDITFNDYGNYVHFSTLFGYGPANHVHDPEIERITAPSAEKIYSRSNPICDNPRFILRNLGSSPLTHLTIYYGILGGQEESFLWTGNLAFMEQEEVELTYGDALLWNSDNSSVERFYIRLGESTDGSDENATNNYAESLFHRPPTYGYTNLDDNRVIILLRTNNAYLETSYTLYNQFDEVVFERSDFSEANTLYRDTIALNAGCYTFHLKDSDDDGLDFFANNDGSGYCKLDRVSGIDFESFERDFGKEIIHRFHFETNLINSVEELQQSAKARLFPNPASSVVQIETSGMDRQLSVNVTDALGRLISSQEVYRKNVYESFAMDVQHLPKGLYFVNISDGNLFSALKLIKQ